MPDLTELPLLFAIPVFAVAAIVVWMAGVRITRYANVISERTGMGQALVGLLLLGGVTSLPELAVAITSAAAGDGPLAVNSILGGIAMQVAILALADALIGRKALTHVLPDPTIMLRGGLKILLLSIVTAAIVVGDTPVVFAGVWMWLLAIATGISMWILSRVQGTQPWRANEKEFTIEKEDARAKKKAEKDADKSLKWAVTRAAIAGTLIIIAGYVLSRTGDAIAQQSGLGQSFVATILLAIATSLPELSTVFSAVRAGLYTMAVSDIFGTNLFDISFLFLADVFDGGGAIMANAGPYEAFASIIAISVTAAFMVGLAERRNRTFLRMGYDSLAVLTIYFAGLIVLFFLRDTGGGG